ncbi:MAG: glycoside hydrolase family 16 protein [bacterium]
MKKLLLLTLFLCGAMSIIACTDEATTVTTTATTTVETTVETTSTTIETTIETTTETTTETMTETMTTTTLDPDSLEANIPAECAGVEIVSGWVPTWCEEFTYTGAVDAAKWRHQTGGGGFGNEELQYYTSRSENAYVDGEKLIITAIKESYYSHAYTSAKIWTQGIKNWKYGKFEMRAKLPGVPGTWPAFWMMPKSSVYGSWPNSGEIDILEHTAYYNLDTAVGSIHTEAYNHKIGTQISFSRHLDGLTSGFHTYSVTWNEYSFSWYVDNYKYGTTTFNAAAVAYGEMAVSAAWPFDQEFYLIINLAMGGSMGGVVDSGFTSDTFEIDYVRVYQRDYVTGDTGSPRSVSGLEAVNAVENTAYLLWTRAVDDKQVLRYNVYINGSYLKSVSVNVVKLTNLILLQDYLVEIEAEDYAGNLSAKTAINFHTEPAS